MCKTDKLEKMMKACLEEANGFFEVANTINSAMYLNPYFVNYSFCCELYFKALMMKTSIDGKYEKGHDLLILFNALPENERKDILRQFSAVSSVDLLKFLKEECRAFENWRYEFEKKELFGNITTFQKLSDVLHAYVNDKFDS